MESIIQKQPYGDVLTLDENKGSEGHFITRFMNAAEALAQFFRVQFRIRGEGREARRKLTDTFGLATREDLEKISEELDRIQGKVRAAKRGN